MTSIRVREAQEADVPALVQFVGDILRETDAQKAPLFDEAFWRWEYRTPGHEALVVLALEDARVVGAFHLTPRPMRWNGEARTMVLLQDLGVHTEFRRHGIFMDMSTFAVDEAARRGWDVTYSLPNPRSYRGFIQKQGYTHITSVPVRVSPLNLGAAAASRLPLPPLWRALGAPITRAARALFSVRSTDEMRMIERFEADVDVLGAAFADSAGSGCARDSAFLNWRFIDKPGRLYEAHGLFHDGILKAYVVTRRMRMFGLDCLVLMDFAGQADALLPLISARMDAAARDGAGLAVTMGLHPRMGSLARLGFVTVPNRLNPRVLHFIVRTHTGRVTNVALPSSWALTLADWDVL
jgi:GNAT superfamily N-acetyltransferase